MSRSPVNSTNASLFVAQARVHFHAAGQVEIAVNLAAAVGHLERDGVIDPYQIYGLTTGQTSPTSRIGMKTKSMPFGNVEGPVNPIALALAAGATFVARGFSGEQKHLTALVKQGIEHQGFSFLDVFSPCVTYNHDNTYQWFRPRVKKLEDEPAYDPSVWLAAMEKALLWGDEIPIGKFFQRTDVPTLHGAEPVLNEGPLTRRSTRLPEAVTRSFVEELM